MCRKVAQQSRFYIRHVAKTDQQATCSPCDRLINCCME